MPERPRLLVVDDEESVAITVSEVLFREGFEVDTVLSGEDALQRLQQSRYDLVLTDLHMEGIDGISVLAEVRERAPLTIAIVLTGFASLESAITAMRQGAYDYLIKPCIIEDLKITIQRGITHRRLMLAEQETRIELERLNRELEDRVRERTAELQRVNEELEYANRTKDVFFATLSHELRTPLTPILGWSKLLRSGNADEALMAQGLESIERNAHMQRKLIDDLLDISRIVTGKLYFDQEPTDLRHVVDAAVETVREKALAQGVELEIEKPDTPLIVQGSPVRLHQIAGNLLSNSVKFTRPGGKISVSLSQVGQEARLTVSDTGMGIVPEFLPRIFEPFTQADSSYTRQQGGLGLGLAIVRKLAEQHGGWVNAESEGLGKGSKFTFALPCAMAHSAVYEDTSPSKGAAIPDLVLIVEDSTDTIDLLKTFFSQMGCQVLTAHSGAEALKLVTVDKPHLIVSDIGLPGMDGYEMLTRVRQIPELAKVPAIALSGYAREEDRSRALSSGFSAHMAKPIDLEKLLSLIKRLTSSAAI